jgi:hypothetical protein
MTPQVHRTALITVNQVIFIRSILGALLALATLLTPSSAQSQLVPGSMDIHWNEGATDCKTSSQAPIEVHAYNPQTFILRENLCATLEAPLPIQ